MRFRCGPSTFLEGGSDDVTPVRILEGSKRDGVPSAGGAVRQRLERSNLEVPDAAWDLLSLALSAVTVDAFVQRAQSPDGWTREFDLLVAMREPERWAGHAAEVQQALEFLTTDIWRLGFESGASRGAAPKRPQVLEASSVCLLSGGLDSLIGAIDLSASGEKLLAVSQTVRGDGARQRHFANAISGVVGQLTFNHNVDIPREAKETSQRSRSLVFLAYAVAAATSTAPYKNGETVPIYICENGFIAINPPLTIARIGSLSTRTAHPEFLRRTQSLLDSLDLRVVITNPYAAATKGEMLKDCRDQPLIQNEAVASTSCGRFQRFKYTHCGRCVPCQIRRGAFLTWGVADGTEYVFEDLGLRDGDHSAFDDVRSVAMALQDVEQRGLERWLGGALVGTSTQSRGQLRSMVERAMGELSALHRAYGVA